MTAFRYLHFSVAALLSLSLPFAAVSAQVPVGHAVVGTTSGPISYGTSGLFLVPLNGSAVTRIRGLPIELQQPGGRGYQQGVASLGIRGTDGAVIIGTVSSASSHTQGRIELFVLHLAGTAVRSSQTQKIWLGTTTNTGGARVTPMPDGRVLVIATDAGGALTTGPMANHVAAIVDPRTPTPSFTLLPNPPGTGMGGGLAVDASGRYAYYALTVGIGQPSGIASLYQLDLRTNQACVIATWPGHWAKGLVCGDDGTVYIGLNDGTSLAHSVRAVAPDGCNQATKTIAAMSSLALPPSNLSLDRAAGQFVIATPGWAPGFSRNLFNSLFTVDRSTGTATTLAAPPASGWGMISDAAVHNAIDNYGPASDGQNHYWFENFANPGGQPTLGNTGFSLTMRSAPNVPILSVLGLSLDRGSSVFAGVDLLLDLSTTVTLQVPSSLSATQPLPIPNHATLTGLLVTAQTLHLEANGALAASRGLAITIL